MAQAFTINLNDELEADDYVLADDGTNVVLDLTEDNKLLGLVD